MVVGTRRVSAGQRALMQSTARAAALLAQQAANIANPAANPAVKRKTAAHQSKRNIKQNSRFGFSSQVQELLQIPRVC